MEEPEGPLDDVEAALSDEPPTPPPTRSPRIAATGSVLAAAMLAVGEILEPQNTDVEIHEEAPSDLLDPATDLRLDFGDLPDL